MDNLPEGTVIGDAIPVSELGESYVVDMNNFPEGTVIGDAIPVSELRRKLRGRPEQLA